MRNEIDIKEKSHGAIRNISGLNEEFQGMKLQFHRDGTPVSSYETSAHTSKNHPAFRNLSLLTLLLLFFSAGWNENGVWGQDGATITKASNNTSNDAETGVHIKKEIIYVDGSRELYVPEMRISMGDAFDWYIHWYVEGDGELAKPESIYINGQEAKDRGGDFPNEYASGYTSTSCLYTDNNKGFWWSDACNDSRHAVDASAIIYKLPENFTSGRVICDVSNNKDWDWKSTNPYNFQEPTLLKRYVYEIRPASECVTKLNTEGPEEFVIDFPKGSSTVNFTMPSLPSNYFWGTSSPYSQGNKFAFSTKENGTYTDFYLIEKPSGTQKSLSLQQVQQINLSGVNSSVTYYVKVKDSNGNMFSNVVAKFTFNPIEDSGFVLEKDINSNRKPWENKELYEEIGSVDFDLDATETSLTPENNVSEKPMPRDETVYGFLQKKIVSLQNNTSTQNQYGLFRSANLTLNGTEISKNLQNINIGGGAQGKFYLWIPTHMDANVDRKHLYDNRYLYDRTHLTDNTKYGYFYYIDASDDPGTIVDVSIDGTLCGYTELVVTAWVADMTRPRFVSGGSKYPLPANINLILKGTNLETQEEVVLHRFTSGDVVTDYSSSRYEGFNIHLMEWQQLCYRIRLTSDVENYTNFHLEVQNNEPHTDGADYAIDDVRIYKTLPNIKVRRENNCDASTLIVGTDYSTILRNMGWSAGEEVAKEDDYQHTDYDNLDYRKYRYGLMGKDHEFKNSHAGNVYFSFLSENKEKWLAVNKAVEKYSKNAAMSLRVAVSTIQNKNAYEFYVEMADDSEKSMAEAKKQAIKNEYIMNYRAVLDYNKDIELWQKEEGLDKHPKIIPTEGVNIEDEDFDEEKYQAALIELFGRRLNIPRIRCPWYDKTNEHLYLALIDVNNTDLRYRGEIIGENQTATGKYWVVTFSAAQVADSDGGTTDTIDKNGACTLMSEFTVEPATTVLIDAVSPNNPNIAVCQGTLHTLEAYLNFYDKETGNAIDNDDVNVEYIFDWYLSPKEGDYNVEEIKAALKAYRDANGGLDANVAPDAIQKWATGEHKADGELLIELIEKDLLLLGIPANEPFDLVVDAERIVAMPYVPDVETENTTYAFCSDITEVNLGVITDIVPNMYQGFFGVEYPEKAEVALRLGQRHITQTLDLPVYKVDNMASNATRLGLGGESVDIYLEVDESVEPTKIGEVSDLSIPLGANDEDGTTLEVTEQGSLTFTLNENAKNILHEGQRYMLLIPFAQYKDDERLDSACDGLLRLPVKIVPEYLTWKGSTEDDWYNDEMWNQSTKGELYFDGYENDENGDANGNDADLTKAFSPLYFTKITIPNESNEELALVEPETDEYGTAKVIEDREYNYVKFDMAVDTLIPSEFDNKYKIKPYYINKVNQIYFKPNATLLNQQYLTYDTARVEFNMTKGQSYWLASPLQGVYAGDMYAPSDNGAQETPAFKHISYNTTDYDRWDPAFYQKAWDKTITYSNVENPYVENAGAESTTDVEAVASNWSIEYNDVWVPYSIGKGFYARAEGKDVKVRLPKADTDYTYYGNTITRALSQKPDSRAENGKLAEILDTGQTTIRLTNVDGDGEHFLVGNPYMSYISMDEFFNVNASDENPTLTKKYWIVNNGVAEVGTPDIKWEETTGHINGYIAPMQAFFVERAGYNPDSQRDESSIENLTIIFTTKMMVSQDVATETTRSYEATNPQLTLTASSAKGKSRAAVVQSFDASNQYESDRDAVTLLDSELDAPTVYTVAGNYAAAVNAVHDCQNIPLGVYAKDNEEVELTVEGASQLTEPLYLYDAVTRSSTPIEGDSYTLNLTGSSHGRYFLTTDAGNIRVESDIRIYSPNGGQLIIAASPSDKLKQVQIYDLSGRMVESRKNIGASTYQLNVTQGIYIVRVISEQGSAEAKLRIR